MRFPLFNASLAFAIGSAFLLSACGGGGGGNSPVSTSGSGITSANAKEVAVRAAAASSSLNDGSTGAAGMVTGVSVNATRTGLINASLQQMYKALEVQPANIAVGVTTSETRACVDGGSETVTVSYADPTVVSNGDTLTLSFSNCINGPTKLNGSTTMTFSDVTGKPNAISEWSGTVAFRFVDFAVTDGADMETANGDITLSYHQSAANTATYSAKGNSLSIRRVNGASVIEQTLSAFDNSGSVNPSRLRTYRANYTLSGNLGKLGNTSFTVKTVTDFEELGMNYPSKGALVVTAANNSSLTLTVLNSSNVQIAIDSNGDGVIDETKTATWDELVGLL